MKMPNKRISLAAAVALALVAAGCASLEPNPALDAARADVQAAASNPDVAARAPHELRRAQEALALAERNWRDKEPVAEVNHQAYLARTRARTATDLAQARRATDELQTAQVEVDRLRLSSREREAASAQAEARRQALAADAARADAARATQDAARATQDAARANQDAASAASAASAERERAIAAEQQARDARERLASMETRIIEIEGKQTDRGILVTLGDVLFEFGKADLLPVAEPRLDRLASFLKQFPEKKLLVEGYTDSIGSDSYNRELSRRRAEAVHAALIRRGVDPSRMVVEGYGKSYPVADNANPTGRQMNRRVEVVVSDDKGNLRPRA
jgi:outer membrane protein OmpA-like peptidoglycan-associated protein